MKPLLKQLKKRRLFLGLKQKDMMLRIGVSRQQYQQIESKGNPRLDTLELIAKGLKSELMLVPLEKLNLIKQILANEALIYPSQNNISDSPFDKIEEFHDENPWKDIFTEEE